MEYTGGSTTNSTTNMTMSITQSGDLGDSMLMGFVVLIWATVGVVVNAGVAYLHTQADDTNSGFNKLIASLAFGDCGVMTLFALWVAPMTFLQQDGWSVGLVGKKVGQVIIVFQFGAVYSMLLIAANRFSAITWPGRYAHLFNDQATKKYIQIIWVISVLHQLFYFIPGCDFFYQPSIYVWLFADTMCGWYLANMVDFGYSFFLIGVMTVLNLATFRSIRKYRLQKSSQGAQTSANAQQEIRFFIQAVINAVVLVYSFFSFHVLSRYTTTTWSLFMTTTFTWQSLHASNGFLILLFNRKVRARVWSILGTKKVMPSAIDMSQKPGTPWTTGSHKTNLLAWNNGPSRKSRMAWSEA